MYGGHEKTPGMRAGGFSHQMYVASGNGIVARKVYSTGCHCVSPEKPKETLWKSKKPSMQ